jgi:hypothetical protein
MAQAGTFKARHQNNVRTFMNAYQQLLNDLTEYEALGGATYTDEINSWPDVENANNELTKAQFDASFYAVATLARFMSGLFDNDENTIDINAYKAFFYRVAS